MQRVKITEPTALLRLLPRLVGAVEAPSLVVVPLVGGRSRMPFVVDLPTDRTAKEIAAIIAGGDMEVDSVLLVALLAKPLGVAPLPNQGADAVLRRTLRNAGIAVLESLALAPDAWGDYFRPALARGPRAELDLGADPAPGVPLPLSAPPAPKGNSAAIKAVAKARADLAASTVVAAAAEAETFFPSMVDCVLQKDHQAKNRASAIATASRVVHDPTLRDLAILIALDGPPAATRGDMENAGRLMGEGSAPNHEEVIRHLEAWTIVANATPKAERAPVLVVVGFLHYALGRLRTAATCANTARGIDPSLTMAPLLLQLVNEVGPPEWVAAEARSFGARAAAAPLVGSDRVHDDGGTNPDTLAA